MYDHSSFKEETMDMDKVSKWCAVAALLVLVVGFFVLSNNPDGRKEFMKECQDDGLKHYQCVSLWNGGGIPIFRSRYDIPLDVN
jgi:hypothetical protein